MKPILTIADLEEARSQERAFVFIWVNWAIHARHSEIEVQKLLDAWKRNFPDCAASANRIDVSEQEGIIWDAVAEWLRAGETHRGHLIATGSGPLLWLRSGSIVASVGNPCQFGFDKLMTITGQVFNGAN